jgi:hypothetical protein
MREFHIFRSTYEVLANRVALSEVKRLGAFRADATAALWRVLQRDQHFAQFHLMQPCAVQQHAPIDEGTTVVPVRAQVQFNCSMQILTSAAHL